MKNEITEISDELIKISLKEIVDSYNEIKMIISDNFHKDIIDRYKVLLVHPKNENLLRNSLNEILDEEFNNELVIIETHPYMDEGKILLIVDKSLKKLFIERHKKKLILEEYENEKRN